MSDSRAASKIAVCIGINDYPGTDSDLSGCVNDARDWAAVLEQRGFEVSLLVDRTATGKMMREAIGGAVERARPGDAVVIQYSGHGTFVPDRNNDEPDGTDEALCPWDLVDNGPLVDDELAELLGAAAKGVRLVLLSDSCHSGTVTRFVPLGLHQSEVTRRVKFLPPSTFLASRDLAKIGSKRPIRPSLPPGRNSGLLIAGCQDVEYSYDATFKGRANGAFTYAALSTLKKLPRAATYSSWFAQIKTLLPSQEYPQRPNLYGTTTQKRWAVFQ